MATETATKETTATETVAKKTKGKTSSVKLLESEKMEDVVLGLVFRLAEATRTNIRENSPQTEDGANEAKKASKVVTNKMSAISEKFKTFDFTTPEGKKALEDVKTVIKPSVDKFIAAGASYPGTEDLEKIREAIGATTIAASSSKDWTKIASDVFSRVFGEELPKTENTPLAAEGKGADFSANKKATATMKKK